jgi:L-threonylcarbamoyladenylate synthase
MSAQIRVSLKDDVFITSTDTIPGIFCKIQDTNSLHKIYKLKGRDENKPLAIYSTTPLIYASKSPILEDLLEALKDIPLTLVVKPSSLVPNLIIKEGFVGIRIVKRSSQFYKFLQENNLTLLGTSANFSGNKSPLNLSDVSPDFAKNIQIINIKEDGTSKESSVIKVEENKITVIRSGAFIDEINNKIKEKNII